MNEQNDHDLLIAMDTKLERALVDIKDIKDDMSRRLSNQENEVVKLSGRVVKLENFRTSVRTWGLAIAGGLALLEFVLNYFKNGGQ